MPRLSGPAVRSTCHCNSVPTARPQPTRSLRRRSAIAIKAASMQQDVQLGALPPMRVQEAGREPATARAGELVFYTHVLCPYAERAWLALLEKRVPFTLMHLDLSSKPAWYRGINPRMLVPAVTDAAGATHVESADICRWLAAEYSGQGEALLPSSAAEQHEMERLIVAGNAVEYAGLDLVSGRGRSWGVARGQTPAQRRAFDDAWGVLEAALEARGGPYLLGQQLSLADVLVYPFLRRFHLALRSLGQPGLGGSAEQYLAAMAARPACRLAAGDEQRWLAMLKKEQALDAFDFTTYPLLALHPGLEGFMEG